VDIKIMNIVSSVRVRVQPAPDAHLKIIKTKKGVK
jgi:hypothetical protein